MSEKIGSSFFFSKSIREVEVRSYTEKRRADWPDHLCGVSRVKTRWEPEEFRGLGREGNVEVGLSAEVRLVCYIIRTQRVKWEHRLTFYNPLPVATATIRGNTFPLNLASLPAMSDGSPAYSEPPVISMPESLKGVKPLWS